MFNLDYGWLTYGNEQFRWRFNDIIEIALKKEEFFKELENTIYAYNNIFNDLNDNREAYLLGFESVFGKAYGNDLETIYKGIMDDIHKKHILKLNNVRKKIWTYRGSQTNRKERERIKKEINCFYCFILKLFNANKSHSTPLLLSVEISVFF